MLLPIIAFLRSDAKSFRNWLCQQWDFDWDVAVSRSLVASVWMVGNSPLTEEIPEVTGLLEHLGHSFEPQDMWLEPAFPWEACWVSLKYFAWVQKVASGVSELPGSAVLLPGVQHLIPRAQHSHPLGLSSPALQVPELTARGSRVISPSKREIKCLKGSNCYKNKSCWFWLK